MGGGGLRILPHKSWHVWNFENRERVRRDEEQAQRDEEEKLDRAEAAEQESRFQYLRKKASEDQQGAFVLKDGVVEHVPEYKPLVAPALIRATHKRAASDDEEDEDGAASPAAAAAAAPKEHINFFKHLEDGKVKQGHNKEYVEEKRKKQEADEKKMGVLTYLGQSVFDAKGRAPWYGTAPGATDDARVRRAQARMALADPMNPVKELSVKKDAEERRREEKDSRRLRRCGADPARRARRSASPEPTRSDDVQAKKDKKKDRKKRKERDEEDHEQEDAAHAAAAARAAAIAVLRDERRVREAAERAKVTQLLAKSAVAATPPAGAMLFNPPLAGPALAAVFMPREAADPTSERARREEERRQERAERRVREQEQVREWQQERAARGRRRDDDSDDDQDQRRDRDRGREREKVREREREWSRDDGHERARHRDDEPDRRREDRGTLACDHRHASSRSGPRSPRPRAD